MSKAFKISVITGTRAEYGLLYHLIKEFSQDSSVKLSLIITGMHLSTEFGLTYKEIEKDFENEKFVQIEKVEMLLSSDSSIGLCKSMGLAQISISEVYEKIKPDLVVVLGDRYEIFACVASAMICRIPVAHLHGGEATHGLIDEAIRHSITKMAHLHFTATNEYRKRVIQLGENPQLVFNVGGFGVDNIKALNLLSKEQVEKTFNFTFAKHTFLITFHPVTLEHNSSKEQFLALLEALDRFYKANKQCLFIFTKANSDTDGRVINELIEAYCAKNDYSVCFTSMGALGYLSTMALSSAVVGNSSSGLGEAPSFKIATINIGDRQKGRIKASSVLDCEPKADSILEALNLANSKEFQSGLNEVENPYGEGGAAKKTKDIIKQILSKCDRESLLKKEFFDVDFRI